MNHFWCVWCIIGHVRNPELLGGGAGHLGWRGTLSPLPGCTPCALHAGLVCKRSAKGLPALWTLSACSPAPELQEAEAAAGWGGGRRAGLCAEGCPPAQMPLCPAGADTCPSREALETLSLGLLSWELKSWETHKLGACELVGTRGTGRPHTVGEAGKEVLNFCPDGLLLHERTRRAG